MNINNIKLLTTLLTSIMCVSITGCHVGTNSSSNLDNNVMKHTLKTLTYDTVKVSDCDPKLTENINDEGSIDNVQFKYNLIKCYTDENKTKRNFNLEKYNFSSIDFNKPGYTLKTSAKVNDKQVIDYSKDEDQLSRNELIEITDCQGCNYNKNFTEDSAKAQLFMGWIPGYENMKSEEKLLKQRELMKIVIDDLLKSEFIGKQNDKVEISKETLEYGKDVVAEKLDAQVDKLKNLIDHANNNKKSILLVPILDAGIFPHWMTVAIHFKSNQEVDFTIIDTMNQIKGATDELLNFGFPNYKSINYIVAEALHEKNYTNINDNMKVFDRAEYFKILKESNGMNKNMNGHFYPGWYLQYGDNGCVATNSLIMSEMLTSNDPERLLNEITFKNPNDIQMRNDKGYAKENNKPQIKRSNLIRETIRRILLAKIVQESLGDGY